MTKSLPQGKPSKALVLVCVDGGWAIARHTDEGLEQLSFPWEDKEKAREFLAITRVDLGFVPSALPHVLKRFSEGH